MYYMKKKLGRVFDMEKNRLLKSELRLILELQRNGRLSYEQLAKRLGISVPTVHRVFKKLIEQDKLRIQAIPNPFKFGYDHSQGRSAKIKRYMY